MKSFSLPSFADVSQALNKTTLKLHPSQAHGLICGILCGNPHNSTAWEQVITGGGPESAKTHEVLMALYDMSEKQLKEFLFEFYLVLPSDSSSLPERAEALTLWNQGFLTGLKMTQVQLVGREPGEVTEAINDLIEIAKMNYEDVVSSEEDEVAYVELVEYVRMAIILIYQDLQQSDVTGGEAKSSRHLQ